jgi:tight adherence protein B
MDILAALSNPLVLFVTIMVMICAVSLSLGVTRTLQTPARRAAFDEALAFIGSSELDIDTALSVDEKPKVGWFDYWAALTERTGAVIKDRKTPGRVAIGIGLVSGILGLIAFGALGGLLVFAGIFLFKMWLGQGVAKRIRAMDRQLPQLISGLRANLQAGDTPPNALLGVAKDMPSPLGDDLRTLGQDIAANVPLEDALEDLSRRAPSREMQFLITSVLIAIRSGQDLIPQLDTIQQIVAQRARIRGMLAAAVGQVKPANMLALGAFPAGLAYSMTNADNRSYWMGSGFLILIVAFVLYALGVIVVRAMVKSVENS